MLPVTLQPKPGPKRRAFEPGVRAPLGVEQDDPARPAAGGFARRVSKIDTPTVLFPIAVAGRIGPFAPADFARPVGWIMLQPAWRTTPLRPTVVAFIPAKGRNATDSLSGLIGIIHA